MKKMILAVGVLICLVIISFCLGRMKKNGDNRHSLVDVAEIQEKENVSEEKKQIYSQLINTRTVIAMFPVGMRVKVVAGDTHFDFDGDGFKEKTEWLGGEEGILVKDIGLDGNITTGAELFGDYGTLGGDALFLRGFSMLLREDTNNDGVIDARDKNFSSLKIWMDENHNAIVDEGELRPLSKQGIDSINLEYHNVVDDDGKESLRRRSQLVAQRKHKVALEEIWLKVDNKDTVKPVISGQDYIVQEVPDVEVEGSGKVMNLRDALHMDKTGFLNTMVRNYMSESDPVLRKKYLPSILVAWAGDVDTDPNARGEFFDARKLGAIEKLNGSYFWRGDDTSEEKSNPKLADIKPLADAFQQYLKYLDVHLASQSHYKDMLASIVYEYNNETGEYNFNVDPVVDYFTAVFKADNEKGKSLIRDFGNVVRGIHVGDDIGQKILARIASYGNADGNEIERLLFHITDRDNSHLPEELVGLPSQRDSRKPIKSFREKSPLTDKEKVKESSEGVSAGEKTVPERSGIEAHVGQEENPVSDKEKVKDSSENATSDENTSFKTNNIEEHTEQDKNVSSDSDKESVKESNKDENKIPSSDTGADSESSTKQSGEP